MTDHQIAQLLRALEDGGDRIVLSDRKLPVQVYVSGEVGPSDLLHLYEDPAAEPLRAERLAQYLFYGVTVIVHGRNGTPRIQVTGAENAGTLRNREVITLTGERVPS